MSSVHLECSECHEKTESEEELRNHVSINHLRYVPYQCFHCLTSQPSVSTYFATECAITEHISKAHGQNMELKFICHLVQSSKNELETIIKKCVDSFLHVESGRPDRPLSLSFSLDTPAVGPSIDNGQENSAVLGNNSLSLGHDASSATNRCNVCKTQLGHDSPEFDNFYHKREHVKGHFRLQFNLGDDYDFEFLDNKAKEELLQLFNLCFPDPEIPELAASNNLIENLHLLNQSPLLDQENPPLPQSTIPPQELHSIDESSNLQIEHLLAGLGSDDRRVKKQKRKSFFGSSKSKKRRNSTRLAVSTENVLINSLKTPQILERSKLARKAKLKAAERVLSNSRKIRSAPKNFKMAVTPNSSSNKNGIKRSYCFKCQERTNGSGGHILQHHLKKDVFCCKYCEFATQYLGNVRKHIRNQHKGKPVEYIDKREQYQSEIDKLTEECFGNENSQIAEEDKFENNGSLDFDGDEQEVTDNGQRDEKVSQSSNVAIGKPSKKKKIVNTKPIAVTPPTGTKNKRYYCTKCQIWANHSLSRHILSEHLDKYVFCCKYCDFAVKRRPDSLVRHIRHFHKKMPIEYIDKRNEYQDEINLLREECFGLSKTQLPMSNDSAVDQSLNDVNPGPAEADDGKAGCTWCGVKCSPRSLRSHQRGCQTQKKQQSVNGDASCSSAVNDSNSIMSTNEAAETSNMDEIMAFIKQELD